MAATAATSRGACACAWLDMGAAAAAAWEAWRTGGAADIQRPFAVRVQRDPAPAPSRENGTRRRPLLGPRHGAADDYVHFAMPRHLSGPPPLARRHCAAQPGAAPLPMGPARSTSISKPAGPWDQHWSIRTQVQLWSIRTQGPALADPDTASIESAGLWRAEAGG
ncbi:MAG: hypothetical protein M1832_000877 [Thelocarpon impressellum]|nr:MAG: hypothetical protein M1832_000877 [Thelocarpon impressellum]